MTQNISAVQSKNTPEVKASELSNHIVERARQSDTVDIPRLDPRPEKTVTGILEASFRVILKKGSAQLSIRDVCAEANISRGTFYRYFLSKPDLINYALLHLREMTDRTISAALEAHRSPNKKFDAFLDLILSNTLTHPATSLLETEPELVVEYFRDSFEFFRDRITNALSTVYDHWDSKLTRPINRAIMSEMFLRFSFSKILVPSSLNKAQLRAEFRRMIQSATAVG